MERLVTAYQEDLISLDELRHRMPELRKQENAVQSEVESLETAAADQTRYLLLADTLADFREKIRARANTIDVLERQKILRLLVKEVLVGKDSITIRHSIPIPRSGPDGGMSPAPEGSVPRIVPSYLLRSGSKGTSLRSPFFNWTDQPLLHHPGIQECPDELQHPLVLNTPGHLTHQFVVVDSVEKFLQIKIHHPRVAFGDILLRLRHRLVSRPPRSKPVAVLGKGPVPPALQDLHHRLLDKSIQNRRDRQSELHFTTARLRVVLRSPIPFIR